MVISKSNDHHRIRQHLASLLLCQILSSTILTLPILIAAKYFQNTDLNSIVFFSFISNLALGIVKNVFITDFATDKKSIEDMSVHFINTSDLILIIVAVLLPSIIAVFYYQHERMLILIIASGIMNMSLLERHIQILNIKSYFKKSIAIYLSILIIFILSTIYLINFNKLTPFTLISIWAFSIFLSSQIVIRNFKVSKIKRNDKNPRALTLEFLTNYGAMQIIYSLGGLFTDDIQMLQFRLLLILSIPTNMIVGIFSTSGIGLFFSGTNWKNSRRKRIYFILLATLPVVLISILINHLDRVKLSQKFGPIWVVLPQQFPLLILMTFTSTLLAQSTMGIRWQRKTEELLPKKIGFSLLQIPVSITLIHYLGSSGALIGLSIFNIIFVTINYRVLAKNSRNDNQA